LDITAGVKKFSGDDDDGFDYIYHLPTAPPDRILYRDPFKKQYLSKNQTSIAALSQSSRHSIKEIRNMLNPNARGGTRLRKRVTASLPQAQSSNVSSQFLPSQSQIMEFPERESMHSLQSVKKGDIRRGFGIRQEFSQPKELDIGEEYLDMIGIEVATFRALPDWVYNYVSPNTIALAGLFIMIGMVLQVIISSVTG
jgi:hypothetical protein